MRPLSYTCYNSQQLQLATLVPDLSIKRPDDWHIHLRDDDYLPRTVNDAARYFGRVLVMPNLVPPVATVSDAEAYRTRILSVCEVPTFDPRMALYLTDNTDEATVVAAGQSDIVDVFKLYPAGATTNSQAGVSAIQSLYPIFEVMERDDVILSIHGEVTENEIDIFDREAVFIDTILSDIAKQFPALRIIFEHITTQDAVQFVKSESDKVAATITAHHLMYNRNDLLVGGVKPIHYCLPVLKRNTHQQALIDAAVSGNPKFFLGTDSAPHPRQAKENACGCAAGCYTGHAAIEMYAEVFESQGRLEKLEGFASEFGPDFYGHPQNSDHIELTKREWEVPATFSFGKDELIPTRGGETITWQVSAGAHYALSEGVA